MSPVRSDDLWSIILAGGEGERLRPFVQKRLGQHKPKQYCTFVGTRSMFQHTLDRADLLTMPEQKVAVIGESHRQEATLQLSGRHSGKLICQPCNRDTAAGVFLALSYVRAKNPKATVVLYPSDHFVYPEDRFAKVVEAAVRSVRLLPDRLIVLGVPPRRVEAEYGWIQPGGELGCIAGNRIWSVDTFLEKPHWKVARQAMISGSLWNTLIVAAKVETLWKLGWRSLPEIMPLVEKYGAATETSMESDVLESIYQAMPVRNFSFHLLQQIPNKMATIEMRGILWSDWGRPWRILETLHNIGRIPTFSAEHAVAV